MSALDASLEFLSPILDDKENGLIAAKCMGLMRGYDARWDHSALHVVAVESTIGSPIYNPVTGRKNRNFVAMGKLDVQVVDESGRNALIDHKSTTADIEDLNSAYWRQLVVEGQASHYMLLEWLNQRKVDYAIWDAIRKPQTAPREVSKKDVESALKDKLYCGQAITNEEAGVLADTKRENNTLYEKRLRQDCIVERPDRFFQRRRVPRLDSELQEYGIELWGHAQDIQATKKSGRWPRNSGACMTYGTPCEFLGVCSGHDTIDSQNWTRTDWVHPELVVINGAGGQNILTNSGIRLFQTCRKKYYFKKELGLQRVVEEDRESLVIGTMLHKALEIFFGELKEK